MRSCQLVTNQMNCFVLGGSEAVLIMLSFSKDELLALHRYIVESKFSGDAQQIAYSALLAQIANKVLDAIIKDLDKSDPNEAEQWKNWRVLTKNKLEWSFIIEKIIQDKYWDELDTNQKLNHLRIIASPYVIPDNIISEII